MGHGASSGKPSAHRGGASSTASDVTAPTTMPEPVVTSKSIQRQFTIDVFALGRTDYPGQIAENDSPFAGEAGTSTEKGRKWRDHSPIGRDVTVTDHEKLPGTSWDQDRWSRFVATPTGMNDNPKGGATTDFAAKKEERSDGLNPKRSATSRPPSHHAEMTKLLSWAAPQYPTGTSAKGRAELGGDATATDYETHWSDDGDILAITVPTTWRSPHERRRGSASSLDDDIREIERTVSVDSGLEGATVVKPEVQDRTIPRRSISSPCSTTAERNGALVMVPFGVPSATAAESYRQRRTEPGCEYRQPMAVDGGGISGEEQQLLSSKISTKIVSASRGNRRGQSGVKGADRMRRGDSFHAATAGVSEATEPGSDWSYRQPKIDGFDPAKFKEANSRNGRSNETRHITLPL